MISFDLYRMADGKLVEHWDAMQPVARADEAVFFNGPREAAGDTEATRSIVTAFINAAIDGGNLSTIETYIAADIDRHGLDAALLALQTDLAGRTRLAQRCRV